MPPVAFLLLTLSQSVAPIDREQAAELIVYAARMIYPGPPVQA